MKDACGPLGSPRACRQRGVLIAALVFAVLLATVAGISSGPAHLFRHLLHVERRRHAGAGGDRPDHRHPVGRLRPFGRCGDLAGQCVPCPEHGPRQHGGERLPVDPGGIGIGMLCGAFNGFFIAFLRLQPIVVTLSTMFIVQGVTLLFMDKPGGFVSPSIGAFYMGDAIPGWLPMPLVVVGGVLLAWAWLKRTRLGTAIYAVGSDPDAAAAAGVRVPLVRFLVYVIAGGFYGLAGVFISAQTGTGDPLVGNPMLLSMFAAVVVGGTRLGGGRGGPLGSASAPIS